MIMVLDPVSALNIAAAVVQFVDFSARLLSKTHEISQSVDGRPVELTRINAVSWQLKEQCTILDQYSVSIDSSTCSNTSAGQLSLAGAVTRASNVAKEVSLLAERLSKPLGRKRFKNFRAAVGIFWNEDKINEVSKSLNNIRAEVMLSLLILTR